MDPDSPNLSGKHAQRGFHFQTSGFLFYFLLRWLQFPDLEATIEPAEGEDAKLVYTVQENGKTRQVVELIQYKKRESAQEKSDNGAAADGDDWREGTIQPSLLKKWVRTKRNDKSVLDLLESAENTYYTAIVFGDLSPSVAKFAVPDLPSAYTFKEYPSRFLKAFPIDYKHPLDPQPASLGLSKNLRFGSEETRCRIRVLRLGSPMLVRTQIRLLLELYYHNNERLSPETFEQLYREIKKCELSLGGETQQLDLGALKAIIESGQVECARWSNAAEVLQEHLSSGESNSWKHRLSAADFEDLRYVHLPHFDDAWEALEQSGFVVICGGAGIGKTTLSLYLAHRFLKQYPTATAYYLSLQPSSTLDQEKKFLSSHIGSNTLFILDDQHLAVDQAEPLIQAYYDYVQINAAQAKLVVASSITYGRSDKPTYGKKLSELRRATLIHLQRASPEIMPGIVQELRARTNLQSELSDEQLAALSGGDIGLVFIIARCTQYSSYAELVDSRKLQRTVMQWIFDELARPVDEDFYFSEIVPIFVIGSREIGIPEDFTSAVADLHRVGFLNRAETQDVATYYPSNHVFSIQISKYHQENAVAEWTNFLRKYNKQLPVTCERLATNDFGRSILKELCEDNFDFFLQELRDLREPLSLNGVNRVLNAIDIASRRRGSARLVAELASANGDSARSNFFLRFLRPERIKDARTGTFTAFFGALGNIDRDRVLVSRLIRAELLIENEKGQFSYSSAGETVASILMQFFEDTDSLLDEIGDCLRAIFRCSSDFGRLLYDRWKNSTTFTQKVLAIQDDERRLLIWLRYCESIKRLSQEDCNAHLHTHVPDQQIRTMIAQAEDFNPLTPLLIRLKRLNPRKASNILMALYEEDRNLLLKLLRSDESVNVLARDLYVIALINRRIGVKTTSMLQSHISSRLNEIKTYKELGSFIQNLRGVKNPSFLKDHVADIDRNSVLESFKRERRLFDLVGRSLISLAESWPELAADFSQELSYKTFVPKITQHTMIHYVPVIRGALAVENVRANDLDALLDQMIRDKSLVANLHRSWNSAKNLTERSFCVSQLLETTNSRSQIAELLGFPNFHSFERNIIECFQEENIPMNIANGLFAIAKFDLYIAHKVLTQYVQRFDSNRESTQQVSGPRRLPQRRPFLPAGRYGADFVDIGCLLRAAAAVDVSLARELIRHINFRTFAANVTEETNPGRLAVLILGVHEVSRKESRALVKLLSDSSLWGKQFENNEILDNSIHFARALGNVSLESGAEYLSFLLENYQDQINEQLDMEANVSLVTNWLRVLPMTGKESTAKHVQAMLPFLISTTEYDTRLRPLLEASEALLECDQPDLAKEFAESALKEAGQITSVHKLHDWLVYFQKALRIARSLNWPSFPGELFSGTPAWVFFSRTFTPSPTILRAYTYYLLTTLNLEDFADLEDGVVSRKPMIIDAARKERKLTTRILSLILARTSLDEIRNTASECRWLQPWEIGLIALTFATVFPNEENPFCAPSVVSLSESVLQTSLNEHSHNLEFGLTLCLAAMSGVAENLLEAYEQERLERAIDEKISAIRWLLLWGVKKPELSKFPYYLWSILKSTVLRPSYIAWEVEVSNRVIGDSLFHSYTPDYEALISD